MTELACLTLPMLGRVLLMRDNVTVPRRSVEPLDGPGGGRSAQEHLVCLGKLRLYFTSRRALR